MQRVRLQRPPKGNGGARGMRYPGQHTPRHQNAQNVYVLLFVCLFYFMCKLKIKIKN